MNIRNFKHVTCDFQKWVCYLVLCWMKPITMYAPKVASTAYISTLQKLYHTLQQTLILTSMKVHYRQNIQSQNGDGHRHERTKITGVYQSDLIKPYYVRFLYVAFLS